MPYNYRRGYQMIVHDPRLDNPHTTPHTLLTPPAAYNVWTVNRTSHTPAHIFGWASRVAAGVPDAGRLDALHVMAHGNRAYVEIGAGSVDGGNAETLFSPLGGKVRWVIFWSCLIGSDSRGWYRGHPTYFGQTIARVTGARVVVAHQNQTYNWNSANVIEFGGWEGPVDIFEPDGGWSTLQDPNPFRAIPALELEPMVFR